MIGIPRKVAIPTINSVYSQPALGQITILYSPKPNNDHCWVWTKQRSLQKGLVFHSVLRTIWEPWWGMQDFMREFHGFERANSTTHWLVASATVDDLSCHMNREKWVSKWCTAQYSSFQLAKQTADMWVKQFWIPGLTQHIKSTQHCFCCDIILVMDWSISKFDPWYTVDHKKPRPSKGRAPTIYT